MYGSDLPMVLEYPRGTAFVTKQSNGNYHVRTTEIEDYGPMRKM